VAERDYKKLTEKVALVAGVLQPLMTVPQVWRVYTTKSVESLSIITWLGYCILGLAFLVYGLAHHLKPVWITQILWFSLQLSVVVGILIYG
jgi:uncharacterized protein with PQ loop repeat